MNHDKYLDPTPLVIWCARRGGVHATIARSGRHYESAEFKHYEAMISTAKRDGRISPRLADDFTVNVLGLHPAMVFGQAWWASPTGRRAAS